VQYVKLSNRKVKKKKINPLASLKVAQFHGKPAEFAILSSENVPFACENRSKAIKINVITDKKI